MRLRARRDLELDRTVERGYLDVCAQRGQRRRHVDRRHEVIAVAHEASVFAHADQDVEVARRPAALPGVASARDPDPLPIGDARRHVDRDLGQLDATAPALADVTRLLGDPAVAAAHIAGRGAHQLSERRALHRPQLAPAAAPLAGLDRSAGLSSVSAAVLTRHDRFVRDLNRATPRSVRQVDLGGCRDVAALDRSARTAAEHVPERAAAECATAEERFEDVADRSECIEVGRVPAAPQSLVAIPVVCGSALGIGEHLVGLGGLLEALFGRRVVSVDVGVQLAREPTERALDLGLAGVARDAQDLVVVAGGAHRSSYTSTTKLES